MIDLPSAIDIESHAFSGCTSLTTVSLPVTASIYEDTFYACKKITIIRLPAANETRTNKFVDDSSIDDDDEDDIDIEFDDSIDREDCEACNLFNDDLCSGRGACPL